MVDVDVSFLPDLSDENVIPPIVEAGNYFIMDSEQLVSNPFAELQQEAVQQQAESQTKRSTMTEKLTSVKNNVCENHYLMARGRLEREKTSRLKQLHDHSNRLRHEVKLLDLDKQRHQVEIKRRVEPEKDFSYDEAQVTNTERRLGANIASFYLEKRLKYPVRIRSVSDISLTPTVQRARASLRQTEQQKTLISSSHTATNSQTGGAVRASTGGQSRAQTAKSAASSQHSSSYSHLSAGPPRSCLRRRDSRSAPLYARGGMQAGSAKGSMLPAIPLTAQQRQRATVGGAPAPRSAAGKGEGEQGGPTTVKFAFENPLKILASNEESAKLFSLPNAAYYPGATRATHHHHHQNGNLYSDTSDDDDDDDRALPDRIDLRAMFFNKDGSTAETAGNGSKSTDPSTTGDNNNNNNIPARGGDENNYGNIPMVAPIQNCGSNITPYQMALLKKAQGPPPRLTTDMMQDEMDKINNKVRTFMTDLAQHTAPPPTRKYSFIDDINNNIMASARLPSVTAAATEQQQQQATVSKVSSRGTNTNMDATTTKPNSFSLNKSASTSDLDHRQQTNGGEQVTQSSQDAASNSDTNNPGKGDITHDQQQQVPKYSWKLIRGKDTNKPDGNDGDRRDSNNSVHRAEDLVLQAMTGIPIRNALHTHVPLHSASRALRHTATFKMHKVVERLINERTKYQRHQVDELKRQMSMDASSSGPPATLSAVLAEMEESQGGAGDHHSNKGSDGPVRRKISRVSISSVGSDRKMAAR